MQGSRVVADTTGAFADFGPYVPSVTARGTVAFQATTRDGRTGVYAWDGERTAVVAQEGAAHGPIVSHPDVQDDGWTSYYAETTGGGGVFAARAGVVVPLATPSHNGLRAGPLGPTMARGRVAFRASRGDAPGVWLASTDGVVPVAERGFAGFEGLPVVDDAGSVVFRADDAVYRWRNGVVTAVVRVGGAIGALQRFPSQAAAVWVGGARADGAPVIVTVNEEVTLAPATGFQSVRTVLATSSGALWFFAVPASGGIGMYRGLDPVADHVVALGDPLNGDPIVDFAANPVSARGRWLALRVRTARGYQAILRLEAQAAAG
jgi:hypothetical protein